MSAGNDESEHGISFFALEDIQTAVEESAVDMSEEVVDADQGEIIGLSDTFGEIHTDEQGGDQTWALGDGDGADIFK